MRTARLRRCASLTAVTLSCVLAALTSATSAAIAATDTDGTSGERDAPAAEDDDRALAERFAPVVVVRTRSEPCGDGEPYLPIDVDAIFGHPDVVLLGPSGERIVAPTADDLAGRGEGWHVDFPGNAVRPGCDFERFADSLDAAPTVYARVVADTTADDEPVLALQYWLFYVYNDWNDRHEGDWEMIQLLFDAPDAATALTRSPTTVAFAQHEGAELSDWDDGAVQLRDATRPLVFAAEGSHASYFRADQWFGKSAQSGFGCDDTSPPSTEVEPAVVLLDDADLPPWLTFEGRWGERRPSFNNGPTGPNTKEQWTEPQRWVDEGGRTGAVALPAGGSNVTDAFCSVTEFGSKIMFRALDQPFGVASVGVLIVLGTVVLVRRTRWSPVVLPPSDEPRAGGQILRTAWRVLRTRPTRFARLGLLIPVAGIAATVLQAVLFAVTDLGPLSRVLGRDSVFGGLLATTIGAAALLPAGAIVTTAAMAAVHRQDDATSGVADRLGLGQFDHERWSAVRAQLLISVALVVGAITFVLLAPVLWWQARSAVAVPAALDGATPWARSAELTRGHRIRAFGITWLAVGIGAVVPLAVGLAVLLASSASFVVVNLIAGLVGLLTAPLAAVVTQLQYDDLVARSQLTVPAVRTVPDGEP